MDSKDKFEGRIEEFEREGRKFIYIDLSGFATMENFLDFLEYTKAIIAKYPEKSLCSIANIADTRYDSEIKKHMADFVDHNRPHMIYGAVIGADGSKKFIVNTLLRLTKRPFQFAFNKEQAIEMLLKK